MFLFLFFFFSGWFDIFCWCISLGNFYIFFVCIPCISAELFDSIHCKIEIESTNQQPCFCISTIHICQTPSWYILKKQKCYINQFALKCNQNTTRSSTTKKTTTTHSSSSGSTTSNRYKNINCSQIVLCNYIRW